MSNVNEVIGRLRAAAGFQGRYPVLHREAADALEAEHAEVESLRGTLSATDDFRIADWQKLEAERDDAEATSERLRARLHDREIRLGEQREMTERARAIPELLRHENARLTAQLQASKDVYAEDVYGWRDKATESLARAERAEAELGMVEQRYSAYDRQIAHLTAQLQQVREVYEGGLMLLGGEPDDCCTISPRSLAEALEMDAAADEPKRMVCPGCGHEVYLDPMDGWRNDSDGFTCDPPRTTHSEHILGGE